MVGIIALTNRGEAMRMIVGGFVATEIFGQNSEDEEADISFSEISETFRE